MAMKNVITMLQIRRRHPRLLDLSVNVMSIADDTTPHTTETDNKVLISSVLTESTTHIMSDLFKRNSSSLLISISDSRSRPGQRSPTSPLTPTGTVTAMLLRSPSLKHHRARRSSLSSPLSPLSPSPLSPLWKPISTSKEARTREYSKRSSQGYGTLNMTTSGAKRRKPRRNSGHRFRFVSEQDTRRLSFANVSKPADYWRVVLKKPYVTCDV